MRVNFSLALCLFSLLSLVAKTTCSLTRNHKLQEFQERLQEILAPSPSAYAPLSSPASDIPKMVGRVIYPIGYGADPTGAEESSDAILEAFGDAFELQSGRQLLPHISDLGGVEVDFQGGSYKISKPIRFPASRGGNLLVKGGTLRASDTFPCDRHLVELLSPTHPSSAMHTHLLEHHPYDNITSAKAQDSGVRYEDITFRDILFDSSFCGGGLAVADSARTRVTSCFFLHFTSQGILVRNGHETFISNTFLGQNSTVGGDPNEKHYSGTGIDLSSNDNAITDSVIFSAAVGIVLSGEANVVTGVHCYNKATGYGGVGIEVKAHLTRITNCYLDYTAIVVEDPVGVQITNGLFLGDANIVLRSNRGRISGVIITNNMFNGDKGKKDSAETVKVEGEFREVEQVVIDGNVAVGMRLKSTVGKAVVGGNGTRWVADFSSTLVFPDRISNFQYSFYVKGGAIPAHHAVTSVSKNMVVVEADRAVDGVVSVAVDQYAVGGETNVNFMA